MPPVRAADVAVLSCCIDVRHQHQRKVSRCRELSGSLRAWVSGFYFHEPGSVEPAQRLVLGYRFCFSFSKMYFKNVNSSSHPTRLYRDDNILDNIFEMSDILKRKGTRWSHSNEPLHRNCAATGGSPASILKSRILCMSACV